MRIEDKHSPLRRSANRVAGKRLTRPTVTNTYVSHNRRAHFSLPALVRELAGHPLIPPPPPPRRSASRAATPEAFSSGSIRQRIESIPRESYPEGNNEQLSALLLAPIHDQTRNQPLLHNAAGAAHRYEHDEQAAQLLSFLFLSSVLSSSAECAFIDTELGRALAAGTSFR